MLNSVEHLRRIGRSLHALASLASSGNPGNTDLGVVSSEDLAALLGTLGDAALHHTDRLEHLVSQVNNARIRS